jgi:hypothetical protein
MPKRKRDPNAAAKAKQSDLSLSLKLETTDSKNRNVDAEKFFATAEKWLRALKAFAREQGQIVKWEIVDLQKSSALIEVQPVKVKSGKPVPALAKNWENGLRQIERTGKPPTRFTPESISALRDFVFSVPKDAVVSIGNGKAYERFAVNAVVQRRVEQAAARLPQEVRRDYVSQGTIRGRLAVLDSWRPQERTFSLQLPLAPSRPVRCIYHDVTLVHALGDSFEGMVEIEGRLHYRPGDAWPHSAEVDQIKRLPPKPIVNLDNLIGLIHLPDGQDSVSFVRDLRDAE